MARARPEPALARLDPVRSGVVGAVTLVFGYIIAFAGVLSVDGTGFGLESAEMAVVQFYEALYVEPVPAGEGGIIALDPFVAILAFLSAVVVLVGAGYVAARMSNAESLRTGALTGSSIVLGTVPVTLLSVSLLGVGVQVRLPLFRSLILVGLLFPAALGTIGGTVFAAIRTANT